MEEEKEKRGGRRRWRMRGRKMRKDGEGRKEGGEKEEVDGNKGGENRK